MKSYTHLTLWNGAASYVFIFFRAQSISKYLYFYMQMESFNIVPNARKVS